MNGENKQALRVHIGETIDDMGRRFVDAWHRAERGELTVENAERHVGFETFETFARIMYFGQNLRSQAMHQPRCQRSWIIT